MQTNKTLLVIDGNHACHRAYWKFANMRSKEGIFSSIAYGFPFILGSFLSRRKFDKVIAVFDGGRDKNRMDILPDYKERAHRLGFDYEDFQSQRSAVMLLLHEALGIPVIKGEKQEADDWIYAISRRYVKKGYDVSILSADKDFNQMVSEHINIINPSKDFILTHKTFKGRMGYKPEQAVDYLCLLGDESDNIPGYRGIGEKRAIDFLAKHSSIKEFLHSNETYGKIDKKLLETIWVRNKKLINLSYHYRRYLRNQPIPFVSLGHMNEGYLEKFCRNYGIKQFLQNDWINIFKKIYKK